MMMDTPIPHPTKVFTDDDGTMWAPASESDIDYFGKKHAWMLRDIHGIVCVFIGQRGAVSYKMNFLEDQ
jgi:hypothetical protein